MNKDFGNSNNQNSGTEHTSHSMQPDRSRDMVVNTTANIKKAAAKKYLKKSGRFTGIWLKRLAGWFANIFLTLVLIMTITGLIVGGAFAVYVKNYLIDKDYDITGLKTGLDMTTKIYCLDDNGKPYELEDERIYGTENRSWVSFQKMPKNLQNAFVSIEDERFWKHNGVDWKRTFGAVLQFVGGNDSYGGSTITQQLIKNISKEEDTTIQRKVREIFRALSLSEKRSREEVLEMYLNTINLSRSNYGVQAAANYYFGKDVSELSLVECAALASIPKSPTKYDPVRNPENNKERRNVVLGKMAELGYISKDECKNAQETDLVLNITLNDATDSNESAYSYYKDALIEQLISDLNDEYGYSREYASNLIYSGGLQIYVTMDPDIQHSMEEVFEDPDSFQQVSDGIQPESAMVVMDPYNGDVLGIVGGRGKKTGRRELNRATQSKRQVGSSIKPLTVYAPAMDLGLINYSTVYDDTPFSYMGSLGRYWPVNAPNVYNGKITINQAIIKSKNTTAVKVLNDMGIDYSYNFAKKKLHLDSIVESDKALAPLALGGLTNGLTVLEMTAAYTMFPNGGAYSSPRMYTKVLNSDGTTLLERKIKQEQVISEGTAMVMTKILQNVVTSGTAAAISLDRKINIAGKTGSTNEDKDRYFAGFTPYYVGACWFGYDTPKNLVKFKSNPAMLAWEKVMEKIHQKKFDAADAGTEALKTFDFSKLKTAKFCLDSGMAPSSECYNDVRTILLGQSRIGTGYYYGDKDIPKEPCDLHKNFRWDKSTNSLANDYCPESDVINVALIKETNRSFTHGNVPVSDAIYTYRDVPENAIFPTGAPFYQYTLKAGEYAGYTSVADGAPQNKMCSVHSAPASPEPTETTLENSDGSGITTENGDIPFDDFGGYYDGTEENKTPDASNQQSTGASTEKTNNSSEDSGTQSAPSSQQGTTHPLSDISAQ